MQRHKSTGRSAYRTTIEQQEELNLFRAAMTGVTPLRYPARVTPYVKLQAATKRSHIEDEHQVLQDPLSNELEDNALLNADACLSYRAFGIGPNVIRKLRSGVWTRQAELDLHGLNTAQAKTNLLLFLREAHQRRMRCVRIIHGKGLARIFHRPPNFLISSHYEAWNWS